MAADGVTIKTVQPLEQKAAAEEEKAAVAAAVEEKTAALREKKQVAKSNKKIKFKTKTPVSMAILDVNNDGVVDLQAFIAAGV